MQMILGGILALLGIITGASILVAIVIAFFKSL